MAETMKRVSIVWSSPFCVGGDEPEDAPATPSKKLVAAKR